MEFINPLVLRTPSSSILSLCFFTLHDLHFLLSGNDSGVLNLYDIEIRRSVLELQAHSNGISEIKSLQLNNTFLIVTQGRDGFIKIWLLKELRDFTFELAFQLQLANDSESFGKIDTKLVMGDPFLELSIVSTNKTGADVVLWKVEAKANSIGEHKTESRKLFDSTKEDDLGIWMTAKFVSNYLLLLFENGTVLVYDGNLFTRLSQKSFPLSTHFSLDATLVGKDIIHGIVVAEKGVVRGFKINTGVLTLLENNLAVLHAEEGNLAELLSESKKKKSGSSLGISCVKVSSGGVVAVGCFDNTVRVLDFTTLALYKVLQFHTKSILSLSFNVSGELLAVGSKDGQLTVWKRLKG